MNLTKKEKKIMLYAIELTIREYQNTRSEWRRKFWGYSDSIIKELNDRIEVLERLKTSVSHSKEGVP